jgi:hypothetical protein
MLENYSEYTLVYASLDDFKKAVNKKLRKGWVLYGNPFEKSGYFAQAMVKKNEKDKEYV